MFPCKYLLNYTIQTRLALNKCVQNRFVIIVLEFVPVHSIATPCMYIMIYLNTDLPLWKGWAYIYIIVIILYY